ncbi:tetratricopeptide repeat protein [Streptomyces sp. WI04-05B]|uniref:tetratricopeptide repeat protein n=1 Tax=Streptomyces TaxID=1883 RepID=UPI0029B5F260|nr:MULTISPECIES: tetratricopeptide repeat protein [unclassified Streptomyces]MDX2547024.1 tetratricopeptide repeat protein [Streptomyces sp. WI04-05B]MDX2589713.1 tetratricopeptide repeat protein [Streptomyces sp. WI04-05A]
MGGIGKTALAVEAAHQAYAQAWFPGGTLFVDLRGYDDDPVTADQAVLALLDALGVRGPDLPPSTARQYDVYRQLLAERPDRTLLILDNASDPAQYLPLLPGTDHHRVLITSRDRPDSLTGVRLIDLEALPPEDSAALITRALHDADERDDRPAREPDALHELTALCGHLPLALQIAAAMLRRRRLRGIASLVTEIMQAEDPTAVLDNGTRGTDLYGRALALRPILETSYRRLPPDQARLLRLLALAPGPDTSTEAVAALTDLGTETALRLLEDLAATHLVTPVRTDDGSDAGVRWRLHDLVRVFGVGVVAGDAGFVEEGEEARERVLDFYLARAGAANDWLRRLPGLPVPGRFGGRGEALGWLDGERAGLVEAVGWGERERFADTAWRLAACLGVYLEWRRYFDDWVGVGRAGLEAAVHTGNRHREAGAWNNLGIALREAGRVAEAVEAHTRARDLHQAVGNRDREAMAWNNLGGALREAGRVAEAVEAHTRARDLHQAVGDRHGEASAWNNLGIALREAGGVAEAVEAYTRARDLYQAVGDRHREASAWNNLGIALREAGRVGEAVEGYGKALEIYREFEDWYRTGEVLHNLARTHKAAGRPAEAGACSLQAADAFTRVGDTAEADRARTWANEQQ